METVVIQLTSNELLEALAAATVGESDRSDGYTVTDLVEITKRDQRWVRQHLVMLKAEGMLRPVKVRREALDGRIQHVSAYQFIAKDA
jgi:hypothetical protein